MSTISDRVIGKLRQMRLNLHLILDELGIRSRSRPIVLNDWVEYTADRRIGHALADKVFTVCGRRSTSSFNRAVDFTPIVPCAACIAAGAR